MQCPNCGHTMRIEISPLSSEYVYTCEWCGCSVDVDANYSGSALADVMMHIMTRFEWSAEKRIARAKAYIFRQNTTPSREPELIYSQRLTELKQQYQGLSMLLHKIDHIAHSNASDEEVSRAISTLIDEYDGRAPDLQNQAPGNNKQNAITPLLRHKGDRSMIAQEVKMKDD